MEVETPLIIAHRGASSIAPENTRSSIVAAIGEKAPVIEFDVRQTTDGELVLFHDEDFERLAGREGSVEAVDWKEFGALDVGRWFGDGKFAGENPIRMSLAIQLCLGGGVIPLIERKSGSASAYAEAIRELEAERKVIVQSFDWAFLREMQREMPDLSIGALGSKKLSSDRIGELEDMGPAWVGWKFSDLRTPDLAKLHDLGFRVALWTVNDPAVAKRWLEAGIDGIITDRPAEMIRQLESVD
ncbi:MAG: glycerophosphodiester phosphodiesterase family protein [Verrucomicrobiales bacterium]